MDLFWNYSISRKYHEYLLLTLETVGEEMLLYWEIRAVLDVCVDVCVWIWIWSIGKKSQILPTKGALTFWQEVPRFITPYSAAQHNIQYSIYKYTLYWKKRQCGGAAYILWSFIPMKIKIPSQRHSFSLCFNSRFYAIKKSLRKHSCWNCKRFCLTYPYCSISMYIFHDYYCSDQTLRQSWRTAARSS